MSRMQERWFDIVDIIIPTLVVKVIILCKNVSNTLSEDDYFYSNDCPRVDAF